MFRWKQFLNTIFNFSDIKLISNNFNCKIRSNQLMNCRSEDLINLSALYETTSEAFTIMKQYQFYWQCFLNKEMLWQTEMILTLSTPSNYNGLFHSLLWITLKWSVGVIGLNLNPSLNKEPVSWWTLFLYMVLYLLQEQAEQWTSDQLDLF